MKDLTDYRERLPELSPVDEQAIPSALRCMWRSRWMLLSGESRATGLPKVRFTVGRMMVVVAIVAMALGLGVTVHRRKERCLRLANDHQRQSEAWSAEATKGLICFMGLGPTPGGRAATEREAVELLSNRSGTRAGLAMKRAFEHMHLSEAYQSAADRPWPDFVFRSFEP